MAANALALPIFAITLFVSAFLLFLVQPMIGRMILPGLGGTPQVWNTCMLFFQTVLLAGYAYTHFVSTRLKVRSQLMLHGALLFLPLLLMFWMGAFNEQVYGFVTSRPPVGGDPLIVIFRTLGLLLIVVGVPFFVVSTSAPLLQRWFTFTGHPAARDPYFLYGASNLGSMLALVLYPIFIERELGLGDQSWTWLIGYISLVVLFFVCVGMVWKAPPTVHLPAGAEESAVQKEEVKVEEKREFAITAKKPEAASFASKIRKGAKQKGKGPPSPALVAGKPPAAARPSIAYTETRSDDITPWRRLRWVGLSAAPSSLMLGIITYISTDVSPIPLFWVIPLALYLLSFILVFARWPVVWTRQPHTLMAISFPMLFIMFLLILILEMINPVYRSITMSILTFFLTAMVCHGELARDRPSAKHLTEFYLWMSVGGMLGGVFNGLFAPVLFWGLAELPIAMVLACLLRPYANKLYPVERPVLIAFCAGLGLFVGWIFFRDSNVWIGSIGGLIVGAIVGLIASFDTFETSGWSDNFLLSAFPGLGEWFDEKGKEMAAEAQSGAPVESAPAETGKKLIKTKTAPDYYLLNYTLDVALPVLLVLFMLLMMHFAGPIYIDQNRQPRAYAGADGSITKGVYYLLNKTFGMSVDTAWDLANQIGGNLLRYGVPVLCTLMFAFRPLRFGLAVAAILGIGSFEHTRESELNRALVKTRTYFGILTVYMKLDANEVVTKMEADLMAGLYDDPKMKDLVNEPAPHTYLMHGTTHHGLNYQYPQGLRRLATTYYHRLGPVGTIYERFDWFMKKGKDDKPLDPADKVKNIYLHHSDARMPVTLVGNGAPLGFSALPTEQMIALFTEPPVATIGLGTGTMASYGRPFQHLVFYEIDQTIRNFSLGTFDDIPNSLEKHQWKSPGPGPYFNYLKDAMARGVNVEVVMGDARLSMKAEVEQLRDEEGDHDVYQFRDNYYYALVVDAFSSDAIPVHLITKEAIVQYFDKLAPEGVLLVHTSNRHVELTDPVSDIAVALKLKYRVAHDRGQGGPIKAYDVKTKKVITVNWGSTARGHFQSEYIMLARDDKYLPKNSSKEDEAAYRAMEYRREALSEELPYIIWTTPDIPGRKLWTDDYQDFMSVFRWGFRF